MGERPGAGTDTSKAGGGPQDEQRHHASDQPLSHPKLSSLPDDIRRRIEAVQEKSGFVPNVFLVLARRPTNSALFFAYHDALMDKPGGLSKAEREMIVVATSAANSASTA